MYELEKVGRGYYVVNIASRKRYSIKPMTKKNAKAQLRILEAAQEDEVPTLNIVELITQPDSPDSPDTEQEKKGGAWNPFVVTQDNGPTAEQFNKDADLAFEILGYVPGLGAASMIAQAGLFGYRQLNPKPDVFQGIPYHIKYPNWRPPTREEKFAELERRKQAKLLRESKYMPRAATTLEATRAPPPKKLTDEELLNTLKDYNVKTIAETQASQKFDLQNKNIQSKLNAERQIANQTAINLQRQQFQSGLNTQSAIVQGRVTSINEAVKKAKILQAQKVADQQLFVTKVADINRKNFFDKERVDQEAKQALLDAERRRQAIRASVANASVPAAATGLQMQPTLGRPLNLPPSVLWFGNQRK